MSDSKQQTQTPPLPPTPAPSAPSAPCQSQKVDAPNKSPSSGSSSPYVTCDTTQQGWF